MVAADSDTVMRLQQIVRRHRAHRHDLDPDAERSHEPPARRMRLHLAPVHDGLLQVIEELQKPVEIRMLRAAHVTQSPQPALP